MPMSMLVAVSIGFGAIAAPPGYAPNAPPRSASAAGASGAGSTVQISVTESSIEVNGRKVPVFRALTPDGGSIVRGRRGERLRIELTNHASLPITMHPHGLLLPNELDGVPFVTQLPVQSGETFIYDFTPIQAGTYFFHSHFGWELQDQLVMPFILEEPATPGTARTRPPQDAVMMLTDLIFESPPKVFEKLRAPRPASNANAPGMGGMQGDGGMQSKPDLNDVDYDAVLANGRTTDSLERVRVAPGSTVRLRLINGSSASNFRVELGSLSGRVIAVDGEAVKPVELGAVELGIAQRVDLLVTLPADFRSQAIVAQAEGTTLVAAIVLEAEGAPLPPVPAQAKSPIGAIGVGYAQERSFQAASPLPKRPIDRSHALTLEGKMNGYLWNLNGMEWPKGPRLPVKEGERVELVFTNKTMMSHPMHLHGHRFQVTEIDGSPIDGAVRDTVLVMPKSTVKVQFDADAPGLWMMHCHITWHEAAGMLGILEYEGVPKPSWYLKEDTFSQASSLPR